MGGRTEDLLDSCRVSRKGRRLALAVYREGALGLQPRLGLRLPAQSSICITALVTAELEQPLFLWSIPKHITPWFPPYTMEMAKAETLSWN